MLRRTLYVLLGLLIVSSMLLGACGTSEPTEPAEPGAPAEPAEPAEGEETEPKRDPNFTYDAIDKTGRLVEDPFAGRLRRLREASEEALRED